MSTISVNAEQLNEDQSRRFDYFFMEACRMKMQGEFQKAGEMFQNCLTINPNSAVSHFEIGKLLLMAGNEKEALNFLKRAAVLNPKNEWYQIYLAGIYEHANQFPQAINIYSQLHTDYPSKTEYIYHLGDLYTKTKQYLKAVEVYDELEKQEGLDEALVLEKQRLYLMAGEEKKALKELEKLLDEYPKDERYQIMLGDYYMNTNNTKKAKQAYDKAYSMDKENGYLHLSLSSYYENLNEKEKALSELKTAFKSQEVPYQQKMQILLQYMMSATEDSTLNPTIDELTDVVKKQYPEESNTYYFYANFLLDDSTRTSDAVDNLEKTVKLDPSNEEAWKQLVQIAFSDMDSKKVLEYSQEAQMGGIKNPLILLYGGISAHQLKKLDIAKSSLQDAIDITPDNNSLKPHLLGSMGDVYYDLGNSKQAFECYEAALALDAHNAYVLNNYAYYLSEKDSLLTKAEQMSARCIDLEPGNATFLDTYAWILYKRNNVLLAKFYMEKAIHNIDEDSDVLFDHYGDILYANGDLEQAKIYWQKAIDAGGDEDIIGIKLNQ